MRSTWNYARWACGGAIALALAADAGRAQAPGPGPAGKPPSVDEQLEDDLLEGLDDLPSGAKQPRDKPAPPEDLQDQELLDQLDGEDLGEAPEDPLSSIARKMRRARERLAQEQVSQDTQGLQKQAVTELEALIKQQPDAGQEKPGNRPARESTERLGHQDAQRTNPEAMQALVKRVWGHLPDRARQELQNVSAEEFLPKYREVIEDYFRRLAEEE
jgi:hypothetical protein